MADAKTRLAIGIGPMTLGEMTAARRQAERDIAERLRLDGII